MVSPSPSCYHGWSSLSFLFKKCSHGLSLYGFLRHESLLGGLNSSAPIEYMVILLLCEYFSCHPSSRRVFFLSICGWILWSGYGDRGLALPLDWRPSSLDASPGLFYEEWLLAFDNGRLPATLGLLKKLFPNPLLVLLPDKDSSLESRSPELICSACRMF